LESRKIYFNKVRFYLDYILYKLLILPFEVKKPRLKFYIYEILYSALKLFNRKFMLPYPFKDNFINTKHGNFFIRTKTTDPVVISPAYERPDKKELLRIINKLINHKRKVLFVDIGANIGCYSIYVGKNCLNENLKILSIEASPPNYEILVKNIYFNNLNKIIEPFNIVIWDKDNVKMSILYNEKIPGSSFVKEFQNVASYTVESKSLDALLQDFIRKFDVLVLKIDVEGAEEKILKGGQKIIEKFEEVYLLIEAFKDETVSFLLNYEFKDFSRLTPYNIWAKRKNSSHLNNSDKLEV